MKAKNWFFSVVLLIVVTFICNGCPYPIFESPESRFCSWVCCPIPPTISKVDHAVEWSSVDPIYFFRFTGDKEAMASILKTRDYSEIDEIAGLFKRIPEKWPSPFLWPVFKAYKYHNEKKGHFHHFILILLISKGII